MHTLLPEVQVHTYQLQISVAMPVIRDSLCPLLIIIFSLQVIWVDSVQTDGTLISGKNGINVVVAVLEKIYASDVFSESDSESNWFHNDRRKSLIKEFLRYKAYVDTEFGEKKVPGGIWRVTMEQFKQATSHVKIEDGLNHLGLSLNSSSLQIDWRSVNYSDMSVPMYSGLAIMLYLDAEVLNQWPHWLTGTQQFARLWSRNLGLGGETMWRDGVAKLDNSSSGFACTIIAYIFALIFIDSLLKIAILKVMSSLLLMLPTASMKQT